MSLIPLVWSNGIPKLEISHLGISVVAHISDKKSFQSRKEETTFIAKDITYDGHLQYKVICVILLC